MILEITHYSSEKEILHQEHNNYQLFSNALQHCMRYIALAMQHDVERVDLGPNVGYAFKRNGEVLVLLFQP